MKLILGLFCSYLLVFSSCCLAALNFSTSFAGSKILESKHVAFDMVRIPVSPVAFKEGGSVNPSFGFFAEDEITVEGSIRTQLIDFPVKANAKKVYEKVVDELTNTGFDILYQCVADSCGKKDGFRLYLSTRLNDATGSQHYVVAVHGNVHSVFYVADIDGQPRGYSLQVTARSASNKALSSNLVPFDLGSSMLTDASKLIIDQWLSAMPVNTKTVSLLGHADSTGTLKKNAQLAEARAHAVNDYIASKLEGAASPKILSISVANLARPLHGSRGRYVELMSHLSE